MITIKNEKQMKKYYEKKVNAYVFNDNVEFLCDVNVRANISARDINAYKIRARNIRARNIKADNITAYDISYYAVCCAENNIECNSIEAINPNSKHFVLKGELVVKGEKK